VLVATLSGLSKAEVERIWMPFGAWVAVAAVALPRLSLRGWLTAQVVTAIVVNHLLWTFW
jgi:hypothetical protein